MAIRPRPSGSGWPTMRPGRPGPSRNSAGACPRAWIRELERPQEHAAIQDAVDSTPHDTATSMPAGDATVNFLQFACWDHHVHGRGDYAAIASAAMRLLRSDPGLATANLYTAVVCGELDEVRRIVSAAPQLAVQKGGPRGWEPLLYLCYARLLLDALRDRALAIAELLLDRGASPNAYYMAGDAVYSRHTAHRRRRCRWTRKRRF